MFHLSALLWRILLAAPLLSLSELLANKGQPSDDYCKFMVKLDNPFLC